MRFVLMMALVCGFGCGDDDGGTDAMVADTGGTDSATDSGATDSGATDSGTDASSDAPEGDTGDICATAAEGVECDMPGATCGGPCTDECSFCNILMCDGIQWGGVEVFPAPCFDCGPMMQCVIGETYCSVVIGGPVGSEPSYSCAETPAACSDDPSCDCLGTAGVAGDCSGDATAGVTVTIAAP